MAECNIQKRCGKVQKDEMEADVGIPRVGIKGESAKGSHQTHSFDLIDNNFLKLNSQNVR